MLFFMLYDETLPDYKIINPQLDPLEEFVNLAQFLSLNRGDSLEVESFSYDESFFRPFLNWCVSDPSSLIHRWYEEYENSIKFDSHATKVCLFCSGTFFFVHFILITIFSIGNLERKFPYRCKSTFIEFTTNL